MSASNLNNPVIVEEPDMIADQKVTWDCVWFGSYPQAEIVPSEENFTALDKRLIRSGDLIEDSNLYDELQNIDVYDWDDNNEDRQ